MHFCAFERKGKAMENHYVSDDIENVEQYLGELFRVPVGVCIADTEDIVRGVLGYEISDMRREPDPACVTAFQYVARIEWARGDDGGSWRLMYVLYRRQCGRRSEPAQPVEAIERRALLDMPIDVQRYAHRYLAQLVAAAGGEGPLLRRLISMTRRAREQHLGRV
jgi:hypothetical protein